MSVGKIYAWHVIVLTKAEPTSHTLRHSHDDDDDDDKNELLLLLFLTSTWWRWYHFSAFCANSSFWFATYHPMTRTQCVLFLYFISFCNSHISVCTLSRIVQYCSKYSLSCLRSYRVGCHVLRLFCYYYYFNFFCCNWFSLFSWFAYSTYFIACAVCSLT